MKKVGLIVGSLRKDSWNKKVAEAVKNLFPSDVEANFIDISNLPLYNEDLDGQTPHEEYTRIRQAVRDVVFYKRSYSNIE